MGKPHTRFRKDMKILVKLRSGQKIKGVFKDRTDTHVYLRSGQIIHVKHIESIGFQRPRGGTLLTFSKSWNAQQREWEERKN